MVLRTCKAAEVEIQTSVMCYKNYIRSHSLLHKSSLYLSEKLAQVTNFPMMWGQTMHYQHALPNELTMP